jgi:hypothetical protein
MTAPRHQRAAFWEQAANVRDEWRGYGTACGPTHHHAAEQAISEVYQSLGRPRPTFVWVRSPREAQPLVAGLPTLRDLHHWVRHSPVGVRPPLASDLATALARLRGRMDEQISTAWFDPRPPKKPQWDHLSAEQALLTGLPFIDVVRRHVREVLFTELAHGFYLPAKRLLGEPSPVCWYGQQEAHWLAYYEVWRRLGLAKYGHAADAELDTWQQIARTAGWFWPDETRCVISQRPAGPRTFADGWVI